MEAAIPANVPTEVLRFHFAVRPDAPLGETAIDFVDGASFPGESPTSNSLCLLYESQEPENDVVPLTVTALINLVPDAVFLRGDSNMDGKVDLSDARTTLSRLFLGGVELRCPDAADANDDGVVNISDPIATLQYLFLGMGSLPPPVVTVGEDPTPDELESCQGLAS